MKIRFWFGPLLLGLLCLSFSQQGQARSLVESGDPAALPQPSFSLFLPVVYQPDRFAQLAKPIWAHNRAPQAHEVVLFRQGFMLDATISAVELSIFADTRYEIWLDGSWLGRGPARFSQSYHEYDCYSLGDLSPGPHLIAVLAQWAPNTRRSESTTPYLRAALAGYQQGTPVQILGTNASWRAVQSQAWAAQATLVHAWGLIGPTELVDLQHLPFDWMLPGYPDQTWQPAIIRDVSRMDALSIGFSAEDPARQLLELAADFALTPIPTASYAPRSIDFLEQASMPVELMEQGLLSPQRWVFELNPGQPDPRILAFDQASPGLVDFEILLAENTPGPQAAFVDTQELTWSASGRHPDIYTAEIHLAAGRHTLVLSGLPPDGLTISVPRTGLNWIDQPFTQGNHAGRRLLLAEYQPSIVHLPVVGSFEGPLTLEQLPAYLILDLGRTLHGRLMIDLSGPAGTIVDIGWDERLEAKRGVPLPFPGSLHSQWNQVDSWVLDGTSRQLSTLDTRSGRYLLIAIWGTGPVTIDALQVYEERYPLAQSGYFVSSDPHLNHIWQVGVETLRPNMSDAYTDTPWRERGQWWGDAYVTDRANRVIFGNLDLLRRGIWLMAGGFEQGRPVAMAPNGAGVHMLDYGMLWLHSLREYHQLSGDHATVQALYPVVVDFLAYLDTYRDPMTGLLDIPQGPWAATVYLDSLGAIARRGQSTPINALYYHTLRQAAELATLLGEAQQAKIWGQQALLLQTAVQSLLYLPAEGRYLTSIVAGEPVQPTVYAQAWPLAYDLVPPDQIERVVTALLALLSPDPTQPNINIYGLYWVLEALGRTGHVQSGIEIIENYYGGLLQAGATTWWERFDAQQYFWASLSHGWGAAPNWFLSTYVLGARQTGPTSWALQPNWSGLSEVYGQLPLGDSSLAVHWIEGDACAPDRLELFSPPGFDGMLSLPVEDLQMIRQNGGLVWQLAGQPDTPADLTMPALFIEVGTGWQTFEMQSTCP